MHEQMSLFPENIHTWEYVESQWKTWEANPANAELGKIYNYWWGVLKDGIIVNNRDDINKLTSGNILMFHIHIGDGKFIEEPAPAFKQYKDYASKSNL